MLSSYCRSLRGLVTVLSIRIDNFKKFKVYSNIFNHASKRPLRSVALHFSYHGMAFNFLTCPCSYIILYRYNILFFLEGHTSSWPLMAFYINLLIIKARKRRRKKTAILFHRFLSDRHKRSPRQIRTILIISDTDYRPQRKWNTLRTGLSMK